MTEGKIIAIEGTDGSGKATLTKALRDYIDAKGYYASAFSFPRYDTPTGNTIRAYLNGVYGDPTKVNPYLASVFFATDRLANQDPIREALRTGNIVLLDRYTGSNLAFQGAKLLKRELGEFVEWCKDLEFRKLGILSPNLTLCLDLHKTHTIRALQARGREKDWHELNAEYQERVAATYKWLARTEENWKLIRCVKKGGQRKSVEELVQEIFPIIVKNCFETVLS